MRFSITLLSSFVVSLVLSISCNAMPPLQPDLILERKAAPYLEQSYAILRAQQIGAVNYQLAIELSDKETSFNGDVTIDFTLAPHNKMPVTVDFDGGEVSSVVLNDKPIIWQYDKWFIRFAPELFKDGKNKLKIYFSRPYATAGDGLHRYKDQETGNVYLYSNFEPFNAHKMFPHFDQPDIKAKFKLSVLAPSNWQVISTTREIKTSVARNKNQRVDQDLQEGKKQWVFAQTPLMASYVFSLHAGPYKVWEDKTGSIPLRLFARQEVASYVNYEEWFLFTRQAFAFFNEYFGYSYPFKKYDQLIVPDFNSGAMENIGAVTFNENLVGRSKKTYLQRLRHGNVIAHEMAHMWFGDLVTMEWWNGLWLNESFATYMASLQQSYNSEFKNDAWDYFYSRNKQWGYTTDQLVTTHPIELPVANTAEAFTNFDGITYGKGASVLKQLAFYVGEKNFQNGVKKYLKTHAYSNTTLKDFVDEISRSAKTDLTGWTDEWLYAAGLNTITVDYECVGEGVDAKIKHLDIVQTAPDKNTTLRSQRVQIGFYALEKDSITLSKSLSVNYGATRTPIDEAKGLQCPAFVYPNVNDWGYIKISLDKKSRQALLQHINQFDAGLRKMLWQNLWDDVLDARMSLKDYITFARNNISGESEFTQINAILDNLGNAKNYLDIMSAAGHAYPTEAEEIERIAFQQLGRAEPGSDSQKVALDLYVAIAYSQSALNNVRDYLLGKNLPQGFVLDQDRRWALLKRLNQFQFNDYRELTAAEQTKDKSDFGLQMAIICEAIRPEGAVKEKWFAELISPNTQYKLATQRLLLKALFPANQSVLRTAFNSRIVNALPELQARNVERFLSAYAESIVSPRACTSDSVNRLVEVRNRYAGLSPTLNKILSVNVQEEQRCVDMLKIMNVK